MLNKFNKAQLVLRHSYSNVDIWWTLYQVLTVLFVKSSSQLTETWQKMKEARRRASRHIKARHFTWAWRLNFLSEQCILIKAVYWYITENQPKLTTDQLLMWVVANRERIVFKDGQWRKNSFSKLGRNLDCHYVRTDCSSSSICLSVAFSKYCYNKNKKSNKLHVK